MIWALLALLVVAMFGGNTFDLAEPSEFRKTRRILKEVVEDTERREAVLEIVNELRDLEKSTMKNLNKKAGKLRSKKWGFDADFDDWQRGFDEAAAEFQDSRQDMTNLLGEWKGLMTEEEWNAYLLEREEQ